MSEKVMNNNDLRNLIFSYFRKEPEIKCQKCKKYVYGIKIKLLEIILKFQHLIILLYFINVPTVIGIINFRFHVIF